MTTDSKNARNSEVKIQGDEKISNVEKAIDALKSGKMVLLYDSDDREGETDMVVASEFITPEYIREMRKNAGGLICTCLHSDFCDKLGIPFMVDILDVASEKYPVLKELYPNDIPYDEKSTFALYANHRTTFTGITDNDRALTVKKITELCSEERFKDFGKEFRCPGHVAFLRATEGLVKNSFIKSTFPPKYFFPSISNPSNSIGLNSSKLKLCFNFTFNVPSNGVNPVNSSNLFL